MARYGMIIDIDKCTGCYSCFLACKDEFCGNEYPGYTVSQPARGHYWMKLVSVERGTYPKVKLDYIPTPCQQCENPSCIGGGTDGKGHVLGFKYQLAKNIQAGFHYFMNEKNASSTKDDYRLLQADLIFKF